MFQEDSFNIHEILLDEMASAGFIKKSFVRRHRLGVALNESERIENTPDQFVIQDSLVITWDRFKEVYFDYENYPDTPAMWKGFGVTQEFFDTHSMSQASIKKTFDRMVLHFRKNNREAREIAAHYGRFPQKNDRKRIYHDQLEQGTHTDHKGDVLSQIGIDNIQMGKRGVKKRSTAVIGMLNDQEVVPGEFYNDISRIPKHRYTAWLRIWQKIIHGLSIKRLIGRKWKKVFIMGFQFGKNSLIEIWYNAITSTFSVHDYNGVELGKPSATLQEATRLFVTFLLKRYESDVDIFKGNANHVATSYMNSIKHAAHTDAIEAEREAKLNDTERTTSRFGFDKKIRNTLNLAREYERRQTEKSKAKWEEKSYDYFKPNSKSGQSAREQEDANARRAAKDKAKQAAGYAAGMAGAGVNVATSGASKAGQAAYDAYQKATEPTWKDVTGKKKYDDVFNRKKHEQPEYTQYHQNGINYKQSKDDSGEGSFGPFPRLPILPSPVIVPENRSAIYTADGLNEYERDQIFKMAQAHYAALEKAEQQKLKIEKEKKAIKELEKSDLGDVGKNSVVRRKQQLSKEEMDADRAEAEVVEMSKYLDAIAKRRKDLRNLEKNNMRALAKRKTKWAALLHDPKDGPLKEALDLTSTKKPNFVDDADEYDNFTPIDFATKELDQEAFSRRKMAQGSNFTLGAIRTSVVEGDIRTYDKTRSRTITRAGWFGKLLFGATKLGRLIRYGRDKRTHLPTDTPTWFNKISMVYHGVSFRADFVIGYTFRDEIDIEIWYVSEPDPSDQKGKKMISSYYVYDITSESIVRANLPYYRNAVTVVLAKIGLV